MVAGATGVIGRRLCPLLIAEGWQVAGTTRFAGKVQALCASGVEPLVADVFDARQLLNAVTTVRPGIIAAAVACGVSRMVVQSIAFAYEPGLGPYHENSPLGSAPLARFEQQVLDAPLAGIILRYGKLYGPGTGFDNSPSDTPVHVDAARRAVTRGQRGIYNIAENDGTVSSQKAISELGWDSAFRCSND